MEELRIERDDFSLAASSSVEAWRAARGDKVEIVVVPGAAHDLTRPDGSFAPEYERTLVEWLRRL